MALSRFGLMHRTNVGCGEGRWETGDPLVIMIVIIVITMKIKNDNSNLVDSKGGGSPQL